MRSIHIGLGSLAGIAIASMGLQTASAVSASSANTDWLLIGGGPENQNFSALSDINQQNVSQLSLAWSADNPTRDGVVGEPLIADGVIYQASAPGRAWAIDLRTTKLLWTYDANVQYRGDFIPAWGGHTNRGLAIWKDKVYLGTGDCRLVAIDRTTGKLAWTADVCVGNEKLTITSAPRVGAGKVFIGPANVDDASRRGFIDAYDAESGKRLWRFYTIPGDPAKGFETKELEKASKTWGKEYWKQTGSGSVWDGIQYDDKLHLVYFGVSSAMPEAPVDRGAGRGDELFTASVMALDADTGKYVWHFKQTPNNAWNFDATSPITIADLTVNGAKRRVLIQAPKNGFVYVLDAATGKFLSGDKYGVRMNWASGLDPKTGRPIELPDARYYEKQNGTAVHYPGIAGARTWNEMAFNPTLGLSFLQAQDIASRTSWHRGKAAANSNGFHIASDATHTVLDDQDLIDDAKAHLVAWDPVARKVRWQLTESFPAFGGVLATAGDLTIVAKGSLLQAFASETGKVLWSTKMPGFMLASPVTVKLDGEQYVLCTIGNNASSGDTRAMPFMVNDPIMQNPPSRLLAFKIGGKATMPAVIADSFPKPPLGRFPKDKVERGRTAVATTGCDYCHGGMKLSAVGSVADLRKSTAATHAAFKEIVIGGQRKPLGMPDFSYLDPNTVDDIEAYVIEVAWDAYEAQGTKK